MGNKEHMNIILNSTVEEWNEWREKHLRIQPDLTRINLSGRDLTGINFKGVGLFKADLSNTILHNANLRQSIAIKADFSGSNLSGSHVYGISAWDIKTDDITNQKDLIITEPKKPMITVDNLQLAQFIHLLINNKNIRDVIQAVSNKAVLILGRFADGHIDILRKIKVKIRELGYLPILFDFDKPKNRNLTETVITLASLSKVVICDLTNPACIPQELQATIPNFSSVIFQPIIMEHMKEYAMFESFEMYTWVNPIIEYKNIEDLNIKISYLLKK